MKLCKVSFHNKSKTLHNFVIDILRISYRFRDRNVNSSVFLYMALRAVSTRDTSYFVRRHVYDYI